MNDKLPLGILECTSPNTSRYTLILGLCPPPFFHAHTENHGKSPSPPKNFCRIKSQSSTAASQPRAWSIPRQAPTISLSPSQRLLRFQPQTSNTSSICFQLLILRLGKMPPKRGLPSETSSDINEPPAKRPDNSHSASKFMLWPPFLCTGLDVFFALPQYSIFRHCQLVSILPPYICTPWTVFALT